MNSTVIYDTRKTTEEVPSGDVVTRAICAVSGGLDSATCLYHAVDMYGPHNVVGISIYYGQRHNVELKAAEDLCSRLNVQHYELDLTSIFNYNHNASALLSGSQKEIVQGKDYATIMKEKIAKGEAPISDEYIPNRNSLFLNTMCSIGLQVFENEPFALITGIHSDDVLKQEGSNVGAYPDCSEAFAIATNKALQLATAGLCYIYTPLVNKTKAQVVQFGIDNRMHRYDFDHTWSCYKGGTMQCGRCPTCIDRINALVKAGVYTDIKDIILQYDITGEEAAKYLGIEL